MNEIKILIDLINSLKSVTLDTYGFTVMMTYIILKYTFLGSIVYLLYLYSKSVGKVNE